MTHAQTTSPAADLSLSAKQQNLVLAALLAVALVVRIAAFLRFPGAHYTDEVFQLFEQAHRWAFGSGIVPWEFRVGIRSPVIPALLSGIFRIAEPWVGGPMGYLIVARTVLAVSSLVAVAAVYRMGLRESVTHGIVAGFVAAIWYELAYFAGRPLTEALATTSLIVALSLATPLAQAFSARRLIAIGFCLALCLMLRIQLGPGLLVAAVMIGRFAVMRWFWMAIGGLVPLAIFGLADWYYWGAPFVSYWRTVVINLFDDRASAYGTSPFGAYASTIFTALWAGAGAILLVLCMLRARASALWLAVAIAIIVTHSLIPHKEYRFILPATASLAIVAALASADLLRGYLRTAASPPDAFSAVRQLCLVWLVTSASLGFSAGFAKQRIDRSSFDAQLTIAQMPELCGLLNHQPEWGDFGGYTYLHRNVPIYYLPETSTQLATFAPAYNVIMTRRYLTATVPQQFQLSACFKADDRDAYDTCVFTRPGTCVAEPSIELDRYLVERGE